MITETITKNHRVLVKNSNGDMIWKCVKDLIEDDMMVDYAGKERRIVFIYPN